MCAAWTQGSPGDSAAGEDALTASAPDDDLTAESNSRTGVGFSRFLRSGGSSDGVSLLLTMALA